MERLGNIGENHGFPPTYIFYNKNNVASIKEFLEGYKFRSHIQLCEQNSQPILNLNGNLCLKSKDSGEVIQLPNGAGDFYHSTIRNVNILDKLRLDKVDYVCCVDCENILEVVVDTYMLGLLESRREECDLMYKCTYTDNQRDNIFKRVVLQNGVPKADTIQAMACYTNYNSKYRASNNEAVLSSPVWMNSLIFQLPNVNDILKDTKAMSTFPKMVNYKMKPMNYWSPIETQQHTKEACYVFERELSDLFINSLFRSQAIMVEREEEYFPVIPSESKYSWKLAYEEYKSKSKHFTVPFYERSRELASSDFRMQSMVTEERD
jgi:UDP-N-acetylglucosamine pyrophosphorylase